MKKKFLAFAFFAMAGMNLAEAAKVTFSVGIYDPTPGTNPLPRNPIPLPNVDQDETTITFKEGHDDYTLSVVDSNDNIVYSVYVPSSVTSIILPSTLSGNYELRLYPDSSNIYFYGYVMF